MKLKHVEVVIDDEYRQVAFFLIFDSGVVIEEHYRKMKDEVFEALKKNVEEKLKLFENKEFRNGRWFVYDLGLEEVDMLLNSSKAVVWWYE